MERDAVITLNDLSFKYKDNEGLFDKLNLNINPGIICGLLGKNGTGKTTLLRLITGLLFAKGGTCKVLGYSPQQRLPQFLQEIYFIPEEFYVPAISVSTYINLFSPFYPKFSKKDFFVFLDELDLDVDKKLHTMSYGQKKKFLIAFALATNCRLLLLDEPTNGLDIPSKGCFRKLLAANLNEERTVIVATHQVRDLQNLLDTIVILDSGKIVFNHSLYEVASKLRFTQQQGMEGMVSSDNNNSNIIYTEKILGGYAVVEQKSADSDSEIGFVSDSRNESEIDLEILFNAVISNQERISSVFDESQ